MQDLARRRLPPRLAAVAGQQARRLQIRCDGLNTDDEEPPPDPSSDEDMDCPSESGYEPPVEAERDNHDSDGDSDGDSAACHVTPDEIKELLLDAKRHNDDDDDRDDGAGDDGDGDDRDGAGDDGDSDDRAGPAPGDNVVARARDSRIAWRPLTAPERDLLRQRRDGPAEAAGSEPRGTGHAAAQVSGPPGRARNVTPGDREEGAVERETVASLTESAWACHGFKQYKEPSFGQLNIIRQSPRVEDAGEAECENAKCRFRDGAGRRAPAVRFCRGFDAGPGRWVVPPLSVCKGCARMFDRRIGQFGLPEHGFREVSTGVMLREFCDAYNAWVRDERESYQKEHPGADFSRRVGYAFVRYKHRVRPWQNGRKGFAFELDHVIELVSELEGGYVFGRGVIEDDEAEHLLNFKIPDWQREKEILRLIWLLRREAEQEGGTTTAQDAAPMVFCRNSCDAVPDGGGRYGFAMTHWDRVATSFAHTVGAIMVAHLSADYSKVLCVVSGFSCPPGVRRNAKDVHFYELDLRSSLGRQWVVDPAHHGKARVVARAGAFIKRWSLQRAKTARDMRKLVVKKLRRTRAPSAELVGLDLTVLAISLGGGSGGEVYKALSEGDADVFDVPGSAQRILGGIAVGRFRTDPGEPVRDGDIVKCGPDGPRATSSVHDVMAKLVDALERLVPESAPARPRPYTLLYMEEAAMTMEALRRGCSGPLQGRLDKLLEERGVIVVDARAQGLEAYAKLLDQPRLRSRPGFNDILNGLSQPSSDKVLLSFMDLTLLAFGQLRDRTPASMTKCATLGGALLRAVACRPPADDAASPTSQHLAELAERIPEMGRLAKKAKQPKGQRRMKADYAYVYADKCAKSGTVRWFVNKCRIHCKIAGGVREEKVSMWGPWASAAEAAAAAGLLVLIYGSEVDRQKYRKHIAAMADLGFKDPTDEESEAVRAAMTVKEAAAIIGATHRATHRLHGHDIKSASDLLDAARGCSSKEEACNAAVAAFLVSIYGSEDDMETFRDDIAAMATLGFEAPSAEDCEAVKRAMTVEEAAATMRTARCRGEAIKSAQALLEAWRTREPLEKRDFLNVRPRERKDGTIWLVNGCGIHCKVAGGAREVLINMTGKWTSKVGPAAAVGLLVWIYGSPEDRDKFCEHIEAAVELGFEEPSEEMCEEVRDAIDVKEAAKLIGARSGLGKPIKSAQALLDAAGGSSSEGDAAVAAFLVSIYGSKDDMETFRDDIAAMATLGFEAPSAEDCEAVKRAMTVEEAAATMRTARCRGEAIKKAQALLEAWRMRKPLEKRDFLNVRPRERKDGTLGTWFVNGCLIHCKVAGGSREEGIKVDMHGKWTSKVGPAAAVGLLVWIYGSPEDRDKFCEHIEAAVELGFEEPSEEQREAVRNAIDVKEAAKLIRARSRLGKPIKSAQALLDAAGGSSSEGDAAFLVSIYGSKDDMETFRDDIAAMADLGFKAPTAKLSKKVKRAMTVEEAAATMRTARCRGEAIKSAQALLEAWRTREPLEKRKFVYVYVDPEAENGTVRWRVHECRIHCKVAGGSREEVKVCMRGKWTSKVGPAAAVGLLVWIYGSPEDRDKFCEHIGAAVELGFEEPSEELCEEVRDAIDVKEAAKLIGARSRDGKPIKSAQALLDAAGSLQGCSSSASSKEEEDEEWEEEEEDEDEDEEWEEEEEEDEEWEEEEEGDAAKRGPGGRKRRAAQDLEGDGGARRSSKKAARSSGARDAGRQSRRV